MAIRAMIENDEVRSVTECKNNLNRVQLIASKLEKAIPARSSTFAATNVKSELFAQSLVYNAWYSGTGLRPFVDLVT